MADNQVNFDVIPNLNLVTDTGSVPYWPFLRRPLMALIFLEQRQNGRRKKAENSRFFSKQQHYFFNFYFWDHSLITSSEKEVWGEVQIYASVLKS